MRTTNASSTSQPRTISTPTLTPLNLLAYVGRLAPYSTLYPSIHVLNSHTYTYLLLFSLSAAPAFLLAPRRCGPFRTCCSLSLTTFTLLRPAFPTPRRGDAGRVSFEEFVAVVQISKTWKLVEAGYLDTLFNVINHIAAPVQHAVRTNTVVEIVQIVEGALICECVYVWRRGWGCILECMNVCAHAEGLGSDTRTAVRDRACVSGRLRSRKADPQ